MTRHSNKAQQQGTATRHSNKAQQQGTATRHSNKAQQQGTATRHSNKAQQQGTATRHSNKAQQQGTATRHSNKAQQQGTATRHSNKAQQQGTATRHSNKAQQQGTATRHSNKAQQQGTATPNWVNRTLFHGDNLNFLRAMNSCTVDLIATDPPFNKGRDFHATPDSLVKGASFQDRWSWDRDVHQEWVDQITDDHPNVINVIQRSRSSYGDDMGAFLCFMAVRLLAMRRILKDTGSIYLHCDPTASHYLKELMDSIFNSRNFQNEIIWHYYNIANVARRHFGRKHDVILLYSKNKHVFNWDDMREPYDKNSNWVKHYESYGDDRYKPDKRGKLMHDVWRMPINNMAKERTGYPTQKPLALYERMIKASSKKGDIVLDPFAGCATTCVAAERLGRQWVGIDIWDKAHETVIDRLKKQNHLSIDGNRNDILFSEGVMTYTSELPKRTDGGETASPHLKTKQNVLEPQDKKMSRAEMMQYLLEQHGYKCQRCDRMFDDSRYLELDHNTPRADGGINHISNRILLCSPCNKLKRHYYTLSGLRRENVRHEYMAR